MNLIKCPNCGESYYQVKYTVKTAVYYRPVFKNGINVNPDKNSEMVCCDCLNCDYSFAYESNPNRNDYGKVTLNGKKSKVENN